MSTLLSSLGRWSFRHPWRVVLAWLLVLLIAGGGAAVFMKGTDNSFAIPGSSSQEGLDQLSRTFPEVSGASAQVVVVAPAVQSHKAEIERAIAEIRGIDHVLAVTDPFDPAIHGLLSADGQAALVRLQFEGSATSIPAPTIAAVRTAVEHLQAAIPGGTATLGGDLFATEMPSVSLTELVGILIALAVLIVTFRSFVLAGMPMLTALIGVGLSMLLIFLATGFTTVSSTTPLLALMLGLAVGIDYALFIVSRHQDQVRRGADPEESAARATGTAGSAVVFAGITVLIALIGLGFAGIPFLTTMGVAAAVAVAIAVAVALTVTPAMLGFLKHRVTGRAPRRQRPAQSRPSSRWVRLVTAHPVITTILVVAGLGVLAIPAPSLQLSLPTAASLSADNPARQSFEQVSEHFGPGFNGPLILTGTIVTSTDPVGLMNALADEVRNLPGVAAVPLATPNRNADTGIVQLIPTTAGDSPETAQLVERLRAQHDHWLQKYGIDVTVTGFTAAGIDVSQRLGAALLPFGAFVVGLSLILLMIVFRSIWVPVKAALGYLLSVAAAFGVVAAVFGWGWFADSLHVAHIGPVISFLPIVLMGVLFGLAMDYEVFLVSRMREDYVRATRERAPGRAVAIAAVRSGFASTARVVTAAAVIMFAVFIAFVPEGDSNIKPIALGLAVGIAVDAFLVRMTLTPAVMALLGEKAWWMPRWLDRILPHFDIEGEAVEHEKQLADWPSPGSRAVVAAEGLRVGSGSPLTLTVDAGETVVIRGSGARAQLLAISGRLDPSDGTLKTLGHLLPARRAWVRPRTALALLDGAAAPAEELRRALAGTPALALIDGMRPEAVPALREASLRAAQAGRRLTIVATGDPAAFSAAGREARIVDLSPAEVIA